MSKPILKAGTDEAVVTSIKRMNGDKSACCLCLEGPYEVLKDYDEDSLESLIDNEAPGYILENLSMESTGDGFAKMNLNLTLLDAYNASDLKPVRVTFRVEMLEVQYDLEDHPKMNPSRETILKWLATDEGKRVNGGKYYYADGHSDELFQIHDENAKLFCKAYLSGIKKFNRYYPVIEKVSIWKNPPGLNYAGRKFTEGKVPFSSAIGTFDDPPIELDGFIKSGSYFKSKDSWAQNENRTWTRTEQWTYTPEGSKGQNSWIYKTEDEEKKDS